MRRGNHSKSRASKGLVLLLALVLVFGVAVGGTIAWLTDKTETVQNVFTTSDIKIELNETPSTTKYQMIPGHTIAKDPTVKVLANSEKCYVFVQVAKANNVDDYLEYSINETANTGWIKLEEGVYYHVFEKSDSEQTLAILTGNTVKVKADVTRAMMDAAKTNAPSLSFTAYACQYSNSNEGHFEPAAAWIQAQSAVVRPTPNPNP